MKTERPFSAVYSHILDDDRRTNAQLFEDAFYSDKGSKDETPTSDTPDTAMLTKLLQNPEMAAVIRALASSIK